MARKEITTPLDLKNLDNHNRNYKELYNDILNVKNTSNMFIYEAQQVLNKAKKYNYDNIEVQKQLNNLIIESGNANAEVSQARGHYSVLNERLNAEFYRLMQSETQANRSIIATSKRKSPMITFIDDDGNTKVLEKWEPILQEKGNKLTIALVSSWLDNKENTVIQWEDVHRLKKEYGVEFVNHTHEHKHAKQLTDEEVNEEFRENKEILKREGLTHDIIVQPFGENTESVRRISRNYAKANVSTKEGINTIPLDTFRLFRITLGEDLYTTFEQYKEILDEAISKNAWIIFKSHSQYTSFDENQLQLIRQIIDYCRENGFIEANMEEGLEDRGNLIDVGDYTLRAQDSDYYILDKEGNIHSRKYAKNYYTLKYNTVDFNTPITNFEDRATSTLAIISTNKQGFPTNSPGQLITTKSESLPLSYQLYLPSNSDTIFKRRWDSSNNVWLPFKKIADDLIEFTTNQFTPQTVLPANSSADVNISNTVLTNLGFKAGDLIVGSTESKIVDGVSYNIYISQDNTITVRFINATKTKKTVDSTRFNFKISRVK